MAITPLATKSVATDTISLANYNALVATINQLIDRTDFPYVYLYHSGTQSIANATDTPVAFDSEISDPLLCHDPAVNTRITVPAGEGGTWLFTAYVEFAASATGQRKILLKFKGSQEMDATQVDAAAGSNATKLSATTLTALVPGDYLEVWVSQNSGGALNLAAVPRFSAVRIA